MHSHTALSLQTAQNTLSLHACMHASYSSRLSKTRPNIYYSMSDMDICNIRIETPDAPSSTPEPADDQVPSSQLDPHPHFPPSTSPSLATELQSKLQDHVGSQKTNRPSLSRQVAIVGNDDVDGRPPQMEDSSSHSRHKPKHLSLGNPNDSGSLFSVPPRVSKIVQFTSTMNG